MCKKRRIWLITMLLVWSLAVLPSDAQVFNEERGLIVVEAEDYTTVADEQWPWINGTEYRGFAGTGYMQDSNPNDNPNRSWGETKGLTYTINLNGGTYHVWLLRWIPGNAMPGSWGNSAGGQKSNSVHIGIDGTEIGGTYDNKNVKYEQWSWQGPTTVEAGEGMHTFHIRAREGGYSVDRFLLTTDLNFVPTATGSTTVSDLRESSQRHAQIEADRKADLVALQAANPSWPMYKIDNTLWNHNSLSPGDVNRDGFTDYAVIHEGPDKFTLLLHPGPGGDIRKPWQKVILGDGPNPEYSDFGDFDGDGNLDIVGACGHSQKASTGVNIIWGPETSRVCESASWIDAGLIPGTKDGGHFLYVRSRDVNGDGAMDIVAGGRVLGTLSLANMAGKKTAGIIWIESPADQGARRDLSKWMVHDIDPLTKGGHGFIFVDVDMDGDEDIINCNADWNTAESEETIVWYENPGVGSAKQKAPWPAHLIYQGPEVYSKGQLAMGDINNDGLTDLCVQTEKSVFYFRKTGLNPVTWERIVISKPAMTQWLARPTKLVDINGDGRLDIIGMLIHDEKGNLPANKASVFWMEYTGEEPKADNWVTHVIKWSDGANTGRRYNGEKWDHCRFMDVDGDGDVDIVGNCEEHYRIEGDKRITIIGVVWFENRL